MLSAVGKEIFSAQATSAQRERDFGQSGLIRTVTARRTQMSAKKIFLGQFRQVSKCSKISGRVRIFETGIG